MKIPISAFSLICLGLLMLPSLTSAQSLELPELMTYYLKHTEKLEEDRAAKAAEERKRYLEVVLKNLERFQKQGSLAPALLSQREAEFLKKTISQSRPVPVRPTSEELAKVPRLRESRLRHDRQMEKILKGHEDQRGESAEKMIILLDAKVKELTREGNLKEAKEAQSFRDEIRGKFPKNQEKEIEEDRDLEKLLIGSKWSYYDIKTYSKKPADLELEKDGFFILADSIEGKWTIQDEKARKVLLSSALWPSGVEIVIDKELKTYEGTYLADRSRRHGKLRRKGGRD